jgi:hypothetical protein
MAFKQLVLELQCQRIDDSRAKGSVTHGGHVAWLEQPTALPDGLMLGD